MWQAWLMLAHGTYCFFHGTLALENVFSQQACIVTMQMLAYTLACTAYQPETM